jgi:hypothetical protein
VVNRDTSRLDGVATRYRSQLKQWVDALVRSSGVIIVLHHLALSVRVCVCALHGTSVFKNTLPGRCGSVTFCELPAPA